MEKEKEILIKEDSTLKLSKLIPIEILESAYFAYQIIKQYEVKSNNSAKVILKGIEDIKSNLIMLQGHGHLTKKNKDLVFKALIEGLDIDDPKKLICILSELLIRKKEGRPREDKALEVLLYIIFYHPVWKGKPDFKLITDFINEQSEDDIEITDRALQKRYQRFKSEDALNALDLYSIIGILIKKMTPLERRQKFYELIKNNI